MARWGWIVRVAGALLVAGLATAAAPLFLLASGAAIAPPADARTVQVWPDRALGVADVRLEGVFAPADSPIHPYGVATTADGGVARGRTYLSFPLHVFPPGTDVLRATLYAYADCATSAGETSLGVYKVLTPWDSSLLGSAPPSWPAVLESPVATSRGRADGPELGAIGGGVGLAGTVDSDPPRPVLFSATAAESTATPPASPLPTPLPGDPSLDTVAMGEFAGTWFSWDATALLRAWLSGEAPNYGAAIASAPRADASPEMAGDLLLARWYSMDDPETAPHIVVEYQVLPATPTPTATRPPLLPPAGQADPVPVAGLVLAGVAGFVLLGVGLSRRHR